MEGETSHAATRRVRMTAEEHSPMMTNACTTESTFFTGVIHKKSARAVDVMLLTPFHDWAIFHISYFQKHELINFIWFISQLYVGFVLQCHSHCLQRALQADPKLTFTSDFPILRCKASVPKFLSFNLSMICPQNSTSFSNFSSRDITWFFFHYQKCSIILLQMISYGEKKCHIFCLQFDLDGC